MATLKLFFNFYFHIVAFLKATYILNVLISVVEEVRGVGKRHMVFISNRTN